MWLVVWWSMNRMEWDVDLDLSKTSFRNAGVVRSSFDICLEDSSSSDMFIHSLLCRWLSSGVTMAERKTSQEKICIDRWSVSHLPSLLIGKKRKKRQMKCWGWEEVCVWHSPLELCRRLKWKCGKREREKRNERFFGSLWDESESNEMSVAIIVKEASGGSRLKSLVWQ